MSTPRLSIFDLQTVPAARQSSAVLAMEESTEVAERPRNGALAFFKRAAARQPGDSENQEPQPQVALATELEAAAAIVQRAQKTLQRRAHRWTLEDIEWLSSVQTPWGLDLRVMNISTSGALVESSSKLMPETATEVRLRGMRSDMMVPVRVVRSEVADVTSRGVRYRAALVFRRRLDLIPDRPRPRNATAATPKALAELLMKVTSELGRCQHPEALRAIFELGLQQLVSARDVRILPAPTPAMDGSEGVYFSVPSSNAVLQATFAPDYQPAEEEFRLLKAAAMIAGAVLQFESILPEV